MYALKLLLEDATGQLDAALFGPDGDAFFAGLPPRDMRADPAAAAELQGCLNRLLGQGCVRWVPPSSTPGRGQERVFGRSRAQPRPPPS